MANRAAWLGVREAAAQLASLPAWGAAVGVGSFLTIEFGNARTSSVGLTRGQLSLWIYGAHWEIQHGGITVADSNRGRAVMAAAANRLNGQVAQELVVDPITLAMRLRVTDDIELIVVPSEEPDMEEWMLFLDDGDVLTAGPAGRFIRESSSKSEPLYSDPSERH